MPHAQREREAKKKYKLNMNGTYSKTRAVSEWDYGNDGELREFASEQSFLAHEEECHLRRLRGEHPRKYETLSGEQQSQVSALNAYADDKADVICDLVHESHGEVLQGLNALGEKIDQRFELQQASRASSDERVALRDLIHETLRAEDIQALLQTKGIESQGRRKSALASTAALCFSAAAVQEFLASRSAGETHERLRRRQRESGAVVSQMASYQAQEGE